MTRWLVAAIAIVVSPVAARQTPPKFSTRTDLVRVDVLATDRRRPIGGLTAKDFELRDNGVTQRIDRVASEEAPIDAWLVLDESGSVRRDLDALVRAVGVFVSAPGANDRAGLITLRHNIAIRSDLTAARSGLTPQLRLATAEGYTSLRDALFLALALRQESIERNVIVAFSDGQDTMSWVTDQQLTRAVASSDAVIYAVTGLRRAPRDAGDDGLAVSWRGQSDLLRSLVDQTGGRLLTPRTALDDAFTSILQEMKARYVLTYYPSGIAREGWHRIDVRVHGRRAQVRARRGYFGSESPGR